MNASVIIPALNEEESIGYVLDMITWLDILEIIVVDGGSRDNTVGIAEEKGARIIHEMRSGYGRACAAGAAKAQGDILVFLDADGADDPSNIPDLVTPIINNQADLVLGSRLRGTVFPGAMPWHQNFGNWLSANLIKLLYQLPITDLSPFRAVSRSKLALLGMQEMTYGWPTEMIVKAARQDWRISEIPVNYHPRYGGESKISGTFRGTVLATYYILRTIIKHARRTIRSQQNVNQ